MTFFANSGVAWPKLEIATSEAGAKSLDVASDLWGVFAELEKSDGSLDTYKIAQRIEKIKRNIEEAAVLYRNISKEVDHSKVDPLSPAEIEFAAVEENWRYDDYDRYDPYEAIIRGRGFLRGLQTPSALYLELAKRLERLSSHLKNLNLDHPKKDMSSQVFILMKDWETLASLGRIVAVVNQRPKDQLGVA